MPKTEKSKKKAVYTMVLVHTWVSHDNEISLFQVIKEKIDELGQKNLIRNTAR